jgi:hypothetical protein
MARRADHPLQRPAYWMHEASGVLRPVIESYLTGRPMTTLQIAGMRAYLRQWIMAPVWTVGLDTPGRAKLSALRQRVETLTDQNAIERWLDDAQAFGMDPL